MPKLINLTCLTLQRFPFFCNCMDYHKDQNFILTTSNQNEIQISSQHQLRGDLFQNNNDARIIRLSNHGITFRFRLFMESFLYSKCIKLIECAIATELSRFIFPRVSVFIHNLSHKTRFGFMLIFLIYTALACMIQCSKSFQAFLSCYAVDRQLITSLKRQSSCRSSTHFCRRFSYKVIGSIPRHKSEQQFIISFVERN